MAGYCSLASPQTALMAAMTGAERSKERTRKDSVEVTVDSIVGAKECGADVARPADAGQEDGCSLAIADE